MATDSGFRIPVGGDTVSGLLVRPPGANLFLLLGHGAGAGMRHPFMDALVNRLAVRGVATLRYQFPYMEGRSRRPDPQPVLLAAVRAGLAAAEERAGGLPVFAGGKSMGGRMTSLALAEEPAPLVRGLVFFGFPLHGPGRRNTGRARHLARVDLPMLFLQGTRDHLCDLALLRPVLAELGGRAELHVAEGADHGFHVLKRSGRNDDQVLDELAGRASGWMARVVANDPRASLPPPRIP